MKSNRFYPTYSTDRAGASGLAINRALLAGPAIHVEPEAAAFLSRDDVETPTRSDIVAVQRAVANAGGNRERLGALATGALDLAELVEAGGLDFHNTVDALQRVADANGLSAFYGHEAITHVIGQSLKGVSPLASPPGESETMFASAAPRKRTAAAAPGRRLISHRACDITPEKIEWIWPGRIAAGKITLLGGPPGLGKSQITAALAATVSTGDRWPCDEGSAPAGSVVIFSAEDGIADTIVPRLIAAGADLARIEIVSAVTRDNGTGRKTFNLKTDVELLERKIDETGDVRLVVIDPISAYMAGTDGNGNVETREVLEPIAEMANRRRVAVVAVTHLNKGNNGHQSALNRFAGSIAFVAAARAAFAVLEDSEDETRRLFLQAKNNLGRKCRGMAFRLEQRLIPGEIAASNVVWDADYVSHTADEALRATEGAGRDERTSKEDAADFLRTALAAGRMLVNDIEAEARAAGLLKAEQPISQNKGIRNAREALGVAVRREGFGAGARWFWELPRPLMPFGTIDALPDDRASMDEKGIYGGAGGRD
jgi:putative DNA primase/helicase